MTWNLLAHRSELAHPNDYVVLGGAEQVAAVNLDGEIIVTNNVCAHRGARVLDGGCGNRQMRCPYHGWEGKATISQQYLTAWVGDWLFCFQPGVLPIPEALEDSLDDLGPLLAGISEQISGRHSMDSLPLPCDWRIAVENSLESVHVPTVHPDTFHKLALTDERLERHGRNSVALYKIGDRRTVESLTRLARYVPGAQPDHYFHIFLSPYTCLSSVGGFSFSLQHYMPMHGMTQLHSRLYTPKMAPASPDLSWFFQEAQAFNRRTFDQDALVCSRVVGQGTTLGPGEDRIKWMREVV